ncbi:polysaccharide deacetylase family protein [Streptomyces yaanensis]|uniref:Polysaccharide deacetylase family protein n=1 Tax=Streptomyces yaanensis TaxID=1142239 RepID=A0ABV7SIF5_9ACTN|nr:polysaccharide deacetylase family protein [Streptomyces sp. CGMCC 4.7035]WNB97903.1 polysaccharide deacetylase family protein [Streptomyces sp. CGMCC 4.7035]
MVRVTTPVPPSPPDRETGTARPVPDRRTALRAGAGLAATGAFAAACSPGGAVAHPASLSRTGDASRPLAGSRAPGTPIAAPTPRALPRQPAQISHGPRDRPRVALTFHGQGDPSFATSILDTAEKAGARITVLAVGTWLDEHPDVARRILDGGHDLGNHTLRHLGINSMSEKDAAAEIQGCADRLRRLTGSIGTWFRPSRAPRATPLVERLARRSGYPHVLSYDVDSLDHTSPGAAAVTRRVIGEIRNGSVVSLHFGYPDTVAALPALLHELDRRGLTAVTTTELLS